jgi:hypothetical protein
MKLSLNKVETSNILRNFFQVIFLNVFKDNFYQLSAHFFNVGKEVVIAWFWMIKTSDKLKIFPNYDRKNTSHPKTYVVIRVFKRTRDSLLQEFKETAVGSSRIRKAYYNMRRK